MSNKEFEQLPWAEIVLAGVADVRAGRESVNAKAVRCAATRLRRIGLGVECEEGGAPASHDLYDQLNDELGDGGHSRYNAILARVASFARAAERARSG